MDHEAHHKELIDGISTQFGEILENSEQGIYIYLDDTHKICNKKFSDMLGYKSPSEWAKNDNPFTEIFVADTSAKKLVGAYVNALKNMIASQNSITWKKKNGDLVKTEVILVPVSFEGHLFALHFVTPR